MSQPEAAPPGIDTSVPHPSRVYDFILGGANNFAVDRALAERMAEAAGGLDRLRGIARANRAFLGRAVTHLVADHGIRQFLDIGTGLPADDNVHGVAQRAASDARVVYVDNDPLVLTHADELLASSPEGATTFIIGDLRKTRSILLRANTILDLSQPVAIMLIGILHMIGDDDEPRRIVSELMDAVPPGSYLVVSHMVDDIDAEHMVEFGRTGERVEQPLPFAFAVRPTAAVLPFFEGLELLEPGLVPVDHWRPDPGVTPAELTPIVGGMARKPG
jgi:hypothetical protein